MKTISSRSYAQASTAIERREPFNTYGAMSARERLSTTPPGPAYMPGAMDGLPWGAGEMPKRWANVWHAQRKSGGVTYVVMSYETPIAWEHDGVWYRPNVTYSVTTSKHQGKCPLGVAVLPGDEVLHGEPGERRKRYVVLTWNAQTTLLGRGDDRATVPTVGLRAAR